MALEQLPFYSCRKQCPLQEPESQVRILRLHPCHNREDHLHGTLQVARLSERPVYEALSYTWGSPEKSKAVIVDGIFRLAITESLFNALRDLREEPAGAYDDRLQDRCVWADAICIDQQNIPEKNSQVRMMTDIYRSAAQVITYIGEANPHTRSALELVERMVEHIQSATEEIFQPEVPGLEQSQINHPWQGPPHPVIEALQSMLDAPWSRRLWIVQESMVSERITMQCGRHNLPWTLLWEAANAMGQRKVKKLVRLGESSPARGESRTNSVFLSNMVTLRRRGPRPLFDLVRRSRLMWCADPKDKIYALVGIATDAEKLGIQIDYRLPVRDVYTDAAKRFVRFWPFMVLGDIGPNKKSELNLPSWVPDWSSDVDLFRIGSWEVFCAAGDTVGRIEIVESANSVTVHGAEVDQIAKVDALELIGIDSAGIPWVWQRLDDIEKMAQYSDPVEALWRTLVMNLENNGRGEAPDNYADEFQGVINQIEFRWSFWPDEQPGPNHMEPNGNTTMAIKLRVGNPPREFGHYLAAYTRHTAQRAFCVTRRGLIGLVPKNSQIGDSIVIFGGSRAPFVLQKTGDNFNLLGECYLHGIMKGESIENGAFRKGYHERGFTLV